MASSILVPHSTFPKEPKGKRERQRKVALDFTAKGICASCGHFCWNHLQSMKGSRNPAFLKFKLKLESI